MYPQTLPSAPGFQSTLPKQASEYGTNTFPIFGFAVFALEQRGLRGEDEAGAAAQVEPVFEFADKVPAKRNPSDPPFGWADAEASLL